tara:strand:+ start:238 stop:462 length:225 start_codon:yes stop_codon:yes gene_type:complete
MADANENIDVYCRQIEKVGNALFITLEVDDLPDVDEAKKVAEARLKVGGPKINIWDNIGFLLYVNGQNRIIRSK